MGCDIHLYAEVKVDGKWASRENWCREYDDQDADNVPYKDRLYTKRSYDTFAILADVRNGRGFAGIVTGEGFNPISAPRGLPPDVSPQVKAQSNSWDGDGHSHSWLTLNELLDYDWTQETGKRGWVTLAQYFKWVAWGKGQGEGPDEYCGAVSGGNVKHLTAAQVESFAQELEQRASYEARQKFLGSLDPHSYVQVEWGTPYWCAAQSIWTSGLLPRLLALARGRSYEDVRIVFWFDN